MSRNRMLNCRFQFHQESYSFLILGLAAAFLSFGCSRTVTGGFHDSPDKKFRIYVRVYGALGKAFLEETKKTVRISVVSCDSAETVLLRKEICIRGSGVVCNCAWDKDDNVTLVAYDYGPNIYWENAVKAGTLSNQLAAISIKFDKNSGKFTIVDSSAK